MPGRNFLTMSIRWVFVQPQTTAAGRLEGALWAHQRNEDQAADRRGPWARVPPPPKCRCPAENPYPLGGEILWGHMGAWGRGTVDDVRGGPEPW
jgi:hypothetical protein